MLECIIKYDVSKSLLKFAKSEHAAAVADGFAQGAELLQWYVFAMVFGYYPQAGGTAVFGVGLAVVGEFLHRKINLVREFYEFKS